MTDKPDEYSCVDCDFKQTVNIGSNDFWLVLKHADSTGHRHFKTDIILPSQKNTKVNP